MFSKINERLPAFTISAMFILCRAPYLNYAYYWDESWPYAVAIRDMYHHGISLMPGAMDPELSRGHPLFFHAIAAMWMHIFGDSHVSMHSFALLISVLFLISIYETSLSLFGKRMATLALLLVSIQEMFFVQSAMVLFEMLVAFLSFLSLVFYVKERYILTALCLTMVFYTKESGLIMGFVLGIDALAASRNKELPFRERMAKLLSVGIPCILIGIFFLVQKHLRGWYVFPLYSDLVKFDWDRFWYSFRIGSLHCIFVYQSRQYNFLLLVILAVVAAFRQRHLRLLVVILPVVCVYYFVDDMRAGRLLPSIPFFLVFIFSGLWFIYVYSDRKYYPDANQRLLLRLSVLFIFCFLCFSSMNFFTARYLLAAMIPLLFVTAASLNTLINLIEPRLYYAVVLTILVTGAGAYIANDNWGDADRGSFDALEVQQGVVDYFEKNATGNENISTGSFLTLQHLTDPASGFLHTEKAFKNVAWKFDDSTQYMVFDNIEIDVRYPDLKKLPKFHLARRIEKGKVWAEIYIKN